MGNLPSSKHNVRHNMPSSSPRVTTNWIMLAAIGTSINKLPMMLFHNNTLMLRWIGVSSLDLGSERFFVFGVLLSMPDILEMLENLTTGRRR